MKNSKWWTPLTRLRKVSYSDFLHIKILVLVVDVVVHFWVYIYLTQHHLPLIHHRFIHFLFLGPFKSQKKNSLWEISSNHHNWRQNRFKIHLIYKIYKIEWKIRPIFRSVNWKWWWRRFGWKFDNNNNNIRFDRWTLIQSICAWFWISDWIVVLIRGRWWLGFEDWGFLRRWWWNWDSRESRHRNPRSRKRKVRNSTRTCTT